MRQGLDQIIQQIQKLGPGAQSTAMAMETFGARAGPDMAAAILEGRFAVDELLKTIQASPETIQSAADDIAGFGEAMGQMKNQIMLAVDPLGKELLGAFEKLQPRLEDAIGFAAKLIEGFGNLSPTWQNAILATVGFLTVLGPVLMILGPIISVIGGLVGAIGAMSAAAAGGAAGIGILTTAFPGLATAFTLITGPIGIAIAAIVAAIAIGVLLYKNWDEIKAWLIATWQTISDQATAIWSAINEYLTATWSSITETATAAWDAIKAWFATWWETLLVIFTGPIGLLALLIIKNWDDITAYTSKVWNGIKQFLVDTWNSVKATIGPPIQWVIDTLSRALVTITDGITGAWNKITGFLSGAWDGIKQTFSDTFGGMINSALDFGKRIMQALKDGIGSVKLPIPKISVDFSEGPLGIQIPKLDFGVNWKALRDLVPFLADGGNLLSAGAVVVGERGPELLSLPKGAQVSPLSGNSGGGGITVIYNQNAPVYGALDFEQKIKSTIRDAIQGGAFRGVIATP